MALTKVCKHNGGVDCNGPCSKDCGWNPEGNAARKIQLISKGLTEREGGIRRLVVREEARADASR